MCTTRNLSVVQSISMDMNAFCFAISHGALIVQTQDNENAQRTRVSCEGVNSTVRFTVKLLAAGTRAAASARLVPVRCAEICGLQLAAVDRYVTWSQVRGRGFQESRAP